MNERIQRERDPGPDRFAKEVDSSRTRPARPSFEKLRACVFIKARSSHEDWSAAAMREL